MIPEERRVVRQGFTLIELLVVIGIIAILASMLLPAISRAKQKAHQIQCLNNQKQLALSWVLYASDGDDRIALNGAQENPGRDRLWVAGGYHNFQPAFTDARYLLEERHASFSSYIRTAKVYKCPSDRTTIIRQQGRPIPQVRSYAMNVYLGPNEAVRRHLSSRFQTFRLSTQIPAPSRTFLFQDLTPQSLCTPAFIVLMPGAIDNQWFHLPATHHGGGGVVSFADGHVELRRWLDPRTIGSTAIGQRLAHNVPAARSKDLVWVQERTSVAVNR
jgi:prepilin-type N-terminal cleavage/methylation domain-containing protein/prepilin-type processing-associated H-X9-DG protein